MALSRAFVIYHDDPDGWTSAWLLKKYLNEASNRAKYGITSDTQVFFQPVDYGSDFFDENSDEFKDSLVFMLDFSIQPYTKFKSFAKTVKKLIWIDHHKTAIENYKEDPFEAETFLIKDKIGACALTYKYFFKKDRLPLWLQLIAYYDVWLFPYGDYHHYLTTFMKIHKNKFSHLDDNIWTKLERITDLVDLEIHDFLKEGRILFESWLTEKINILNDIGFEKELWNHRCICVNSKGFNSLPFERSEKYRNYDIWIAFFYLGSGKWTVSLYSRKVDVGEIARNYGGDGHKNAAGFQCDLNTIATLFM